MLPDIILAFIRFFTIELFLGATKIRGWMALYGAANFNTDGRGEGGCCVSPTGRFHWHSAARWAECAVASPGRVRRHAAQFSERSSTPLIDHARVAFSGVLTRLPSTQTDDTQRGGKGHKPLPAP